jgi:adenosylmethionine-8-amino-7-oxononanoate aminotransferase
VLVSAHGLHVEDRHARRYLDATSGAFCVQLGYTRPDLVRAMTDAATRLPYARPTQFESEESEAYSGELLAAAGAPYTRVILTSSGSEAVEASLKIAHVYQRAIGHPERVRIEHHPGHYHGATLGALGVTGWRARRAPYDALFAGGGAGVWPGADLAAVIRETIPAAGLGAMVPTPGDLTSLRARCDATGALWIADEVLTGFGRVGALFAWKRLGEGEMERASSAPAPDLVAFGKGAGAGFAPLAGVLLSDRVARTLETARFTHYQTYGGNPIACAVGRRVLAALAEEGIYARVRAHEGHLAQALGALGEETPHVRGVRGLGFLWGVELAGRRAAEVAAACREAGVLVHAGVAERGATAEFILVAPPLIAGPEAFAEIAGAIRAGVLAAGTAG